MIESERLVLLLAGKVTLILGIVATLTLVAGRRWPVSCALWQRWGVLALLVLPIAVWVLPAIGIPVLSAPHHVAIDGEPWRAWQLATLFRPNPSAAHGNELSTSSSRPDTGAAASLPRARSSTNIRALLFAAAYCLVVVALATRFILAWRGLERLKRASSFVDDPVWQSSLAHWSTVLRVHRCVELRRSDEVSVPMTFGWRVPVILVPGDCISTCDETQRDAIVIHELTHIAHGDFFWQALTRLTASLYWMHPLMWIIRRQDGTLCERISDSLCARHLSRESYGQALVRIAGRKVLRPAASLGMAMARPSSLGRRLNDLASCEPSRSSPPNRTQRVIQGATAMLVLGVIVVGTLTTRAGALGEKDAEAAKKPNSRNNAANAEPVATIRLPEKIEGEVLDQQEKPVAKAKVVISIVSNNKDREPDLPKPWTATTDARGRYTFSTGRPTLTADDFFSIKIVAEAFAELQIYYQADAGTRGSLPVQKLHAARKVKGRLVDPEGNPVKDAVVRFQANSGDMFLLYDSGPLPVDKSGEFVASIPKGGKAAFAVYPRDFAPQIVDVPDAGNPDDGADLGPIRVETGTSVTGRVVDKQGRGIAGTVVAIRGEEQRELFMFHLLVATAVKTDEEGNFTLPPVRGTYNVWVAGDAPDYSRRVVVTGATPPPMLPERMTFNGVDKTEEIEFREAVSVTVKGSVRWPDGSPVPGIEITPSMLPRGWQSGVNLPTARTDAAGRYTLKLPSPAEGVHISVFQSIRAADGTSKQAKPAATAADPGNQNRTIRFDLVDTDIEDADWVVDSEE